MSSETNKNLGVSIVGSLKKKEEQEEVSKSIEEAENEGLFVARPVESSGNKRSSTRTIRLEYLQSIVKTVAIINKDGEYEIKPSKNCREGDEVWIIENDSDFIKTKIYKDGD